MTRSPSRCVPEAYPASPACRRRRDAQVALGRGTGVRRPSAWAVRDYEQQSETRAVASASKRRFATSDRPILISLRRLSMENTPSRCLAGADGAVRRRFRQPARMKSATGNQRGVWATLHDTCQLIVHTRGLSYTLFTNTHIRLMWSELQANSLGLYGRHSRADVLHSRAHVCRATSTGGQDRSGMHSQASSRRSTPPGQDEPRAATTPHRDNGREGDKHGDWSCPDNSMTDGTHA